MRKSIFIQTFLGFILLIGVFFGGIYNYEKAIGNFTEYTTLRDIDKGTFNEYRYYVTREFLVLDEYFRINKTINTQNAENILKYAREGHKYVPQTLINENILKDLNVAIQVGIKTPNSEINFNQIVEAIGEYLDETRVEKLMGNIDANPTSGNAPLTVTFRGNVRDPSGSVIPANNYIWWINDGGTKRVIGRGTSLNYTFRNEGNFDVFLDVRSNNKNSLGNSDVLPFSSRATIEVKERIATVFVSVNSFRILDSDEIKFTPEEGSYGLIFDATSSTPTGGARFTRTQWDFGNGLTKSYDGAPKVERVVYANEGTYKVSLTLRTNEGKEVNRKFDVIIHNPVATITTTKEEGFIGDRFNFGVRSNVRDRNLSYTWNIIDIDNDKILATNTGDTFSHTFTAKGRFNVQLKVRNALGEEDIDTKIIYINSRAPIAEFTHSIPAPNKPARVLLDATRTYDPDFTDEGKLKYSWTINGEKVNIENIDNIGAIGYYTFDSIGEHSVVLEVTDPDDMVGIKQARVRINSILDVDFISFPRVSQVGQPVRFKATSPRARYFEWDFGDGKSDSGSNSSVTYNYEKSGIFNVKLKVRDIDGNTNEVTKVVYVGESDTPYAHIGVDLGNLEVPKLQANACDGKSAYIVDRVKNINFKSQESINIDGTNSGLEYSWRIGNDRYVSSTDTTHRFDELGCFPVRLTVKSKNNGRTHSSEIWMKVQNLKPTLTSLDINVQNIEADPVVVEVSALGARDPDGVIQSYLWYYYTDTDSEPQDFRMTNTPKTTFVIPKITGNYYFVVVMRDNNEGRISSEDISSSRYFVTLSGDNINTPLIDFSVNKSNIMLGEEVSFQAQVKNILGQDLTDKVEYAWDFDGDGFYDVETKENTITHTYNTSGAFYAKVRVRHKGMTNVRTIQMNVANVLTPDFGYVSIGDKYLFFNQTIGQYDTSIWNMGDGNIIRNKDYFIHTFDSDKSVYEVELRISEGTQSKTKKKEVVKNMRNMLLARQSSGIVAFSNFDIQDDKITISKEQDKVYIYLGESKGDFKNFGVDFDIEIDSTLTGGKDDDIDNKNYPSFRDGSILEIPLNQAKNQTFRIFLLDENDSVTESKDITIIKEYIKEEEIDMDKIVFSGITDTQRVKIEKLKGFITSFPQQNRLEGMKYISRLQEEWFYPSEKTKIILDFGGYIEGIDVPNKSDVLEILESFLLDEQEDVSIRSMSYNVVKNLIPNELVDYDNIISKLDFIKENQSDLEGNRLLGREILQSIEHTNLIGVDDKITIKAQLQVLIYGGVENIPQETIDEIKTNDKVSSGSKVVGLLIGFIKVVLWIFGIFVGIILLFFIWYKVSNKNKDFGFQDFIIEKTGGKKETKKVQNEVVSKVEAVTKKEEIIEKQTTPKKTDKESFDPLAQIETKQEVKKEPIQNTQAPDWLKAAETQTTTTTNTQILDPLSEVGNNEVKQEKTTDNTLKTQETKENKNENKEVIPDWLKGSFVESSEPKKEEVEKQKKEDISQHKETTKETQVLDGLKESESKVQDDNFTKKEETNRDESMPDWLKGSQKKEIEDKKEVKLEPKKDEVSKVEKDDKKTPPKVENKKLEAKKEEKEAKLEPKKESKKTESKDILEQETTPKKDEVIEDNILDDIDFSVEEEVPDWLKDTLSVDKLKEDKKDLKEEAKKSSPKQSTSKISTKTKEATKKEDTKKVESKKEDTKKDEVDLWSDGMDIPDWLKGEDVFSSDDKKDTKK